MTKVFIIILNFNGGEDVIECLESVRREGERVKEQEVKILVVDNGSTDNSLQLIKKAFPKIKIIENKRNFGFAAGNNVGIKYALKNGADAVLLLNQDTVVEKGFLEPLLENPADIVGPVIKFKRKGKWVYDYGGKINWWLGRTSHLEKVCPHRESPFGHSRCVLSTSEEPLRVTIRGVPLARIPDIDYVSGCAMFIKRPVFEKIGLLDERFFLYFEDADFCIRARKAGLKIAVEPESIIFHKLVEGKKKSWFQIYHLLRSNLIFINRWIPLYRRPVAYIYLLALLFKVLVNHHLGGVMASVSLQPATVRGVARTKVR